MTCIVGLVHEGGVYMGADSAGVSGWDLAVRKDRKIVCNGDFLMGFTSSFRMGQLLAYSFRPPKRHPDQDVMAFMVGEFVDAARACLKAGGFAKAESSVESGGTFLVGYAGRLFRICDDYQVGESTRDYDACGCGEAYARGAMTANGGLAPADRIRQALHAAETHSAGVRGPFHVEQLFNYSGANLIALKGS